MKTALYRHYDADGVLLYVGVSDVFHKRCTEHGSGSEWFSGVASSSVLWFETRAAALAAEKAAIIAERPLFNMSHGGRIDRLRATRGALDPAASVLERLGGPMRVCEEIGVHKTRVYKWMKPKSEGGTGGMIPGSHIQDIIRMGAERGIEFSLADFFPAHPISECTQGEVA